jgi:signal transduction histidine kinase
MRERLAELDGTLKVERRSHGSAVRATIPVEESASDRKPLETSAVENSSI